jgi:hypothetical protein
MNSIAMLLGMLSAVPFVIYYIKFRKIQQRLSKNNSLRSAWTHACCDNLIGEAYQDDPEAMKVLIFNDDMLDLLERTKKIKFQLYASVLFYLAVAICFVIIYK